MSWPMHQPSFWWGGCLIAMVSGRDDSSRGCATDSGLAGRSRAITGNNSIRSSGTKGISPYCHSDADICLAKLLRGGHKAARRNAINRPLKQPNQIQTIRSVSTPALGTTGGTFYFSIWIFKAGIASILLNLSWISPTETTGTFSFDD